jgi:hypothetical protein
MKNRLSREYDSLDVVSETRTLNDSERERMKNIYSELNRTWKKPKLGKGLGRGR